MNDIIENKKQGKKLTKDEISYFVKGYTNGDIPDYQASALAMAIWFNKMSAAETAILTDEMAKSGDTLDLSELGDTTVDKHSSGGVGDKTTLIVAPIAAAAGCTVAKMSGRGLGFTGGTIDKLESIPNFKTAMSPSEFFDRAKEIGIVVAGQTGNMAPCDKRLYALRDVTATVDSMPLIASSIMSKKIAAGSKNIVLDVKCGDGAFMKSEDDAKALAKEMVSIGRACNRNVSAFITDMSTPLGFAIGNTLEVKEAVDVLNGKNVKDLREISIALSSEMISLSLNVETSKATEIATDMLDSGKAFDKLCQMVECQGGDVNFIKNTSLFDADACKKEIKADKSGYVKELFALLLGEASVILGAGRSVKEDRIDADAGIMLNVKKGDKIKKGDTVMTVYSSSDEKINSAISLLKSSFVIDDKIAEEKPLIIAKIR